MCRIPIQLLFVYIPCFTSPFLLLLVFFLNSFSHHFKGLFCIAFHFILIFCWIRSFSLTSVFHLNLCVCVCSVPVVVIQMLHADCDAIAFCTATQLFGICFSLSRSRLLLLFSIVFFCIIIAFHENQSKSTPYIHKCQCFRFGMCAILCMPVERIACALLLYSLCSNTLNFLFIHLQKWIYSYTVHAFRKWL